MKKIALYISISILTVLFSHCSSNEESKNNAAIQMAETEAVQRIKKTSATEVENAKKEINSAVADVISKADTTLNKKLQTIESTMIQKAEETKKDLGSQIQGIKNKIIKSYIIGLVGVFIGLVGIIIAILAYKKNPHTNIKRVKDLIHEELRKPNFLNEILYNSTGTPNSYLQTGPGYSSMTQQQIIREMKTYISSKSFEDQLENILQTLSKKSVSHNASTETTSVNPSNVVVQPETKKTYELYAKESDSMQLTSIQNSYQKGKSIYKLILSDPNSNTAQVSLCIEQEDAKERILAYDNQYIEPICQVSRLSTQPTTVKVKRNGTAERIGEEWKVSKQVIVEIK